MLLSYVQRNNLRHVQKMLPKSYLYLMFKPVLALNKLQGLICYKNQPPNRSHFKIRWKVTQKSADKYRCRMQAEI